VLDQYDSLMLKDMKFQKLMMEIENNVVNYGFYLELLTKKKLFVIPIIASPLWYNRLL
jgi:hypothetical protein